MAENEGAEPVWFETGTTLVAAASTAGEPEGAGVVAIDVAASKPIGSGRLSLLVELAGSPRLASGYPVFPASGLDQLRVAEIHYDFPTVIGEWSIGYIDSKAYLDASDVANDEKTQFSNPVFVNNPTIGMPQSSLGFSWRPPARREWSGYSFVLAASKESGAFIAFEHWRALANATIRLGVWGRSANLPVRQWTMDHEYGLYTAIDGSVGGLNWNLRAGVANPGQGASESFIGMAWEAPLAGHTLGFGVGRSMSGDIWSIGSPGEALHAEFYYRRELSRRLAITPCIRYLNSIEDGERTGEWSAGVRFRLDI
jgi:hypothetical protein